MSKELQTYFTLDEELSLLSLNHSAEDAGNHATFDFYAKNPALARKHFSIDRSTILTEIDYEIISKLDKHLLRYQALALDNKIQSTVSETL